MALTHSTYSVTIAGRMQADGSTTPEVTLTGLSANQALMVEQTPGTRIVAAWPER